MAQSDCPSVESPNVGFPRRRSYAVLGQTHEFDGASVPAPCACGARFGVFHLSLNSPVPCPSHVLANMNKGLASYHSHAALETQFTAV